MEKTENNKKLLPLLTAFLKIGAFTFGGGYAMIPLIQREIVEKRGWITEDDILEIVAIAESTPGPIAINAATFVGYRVAGMPGAFLSTLGIVLPSFLTIVVISFILKEFEQFRAVKYAFFGIRAGVLALLIKALVSMYKKSRGNLLSYVIMGLAFVLTAFLKVNVIAVIAGCAAVGLLYTYAAGRKMK